LVWACESLRDPEFSYGDLFRFVSADFNPKPRVFDVTGVTAFQVTWIPVKKW
jgi:hypothetical protein